MVLNMGYEAPDFFEFEVSPDLYSRPPSTTSPLSTPGMQTPFPLPPHTSAIAPPLAMSYNSTNIPPPFSFVKLSDDGRSVLPALLAAENLKTTLLASALLSFIFLISKDAHKALVRRAHWIPCDFLVLSAFSIQLLSLLNAQNQTLAVSSNVERLSIKNVGKPNSEPRNPPNALWKDILMIHNSRTIVCIFTAYVMPSMAERGLEHSWVRLSALVITVFHHLSSQFYDARDNIDVPTFLRVWPRENENKGPAYYAYATIISLCFILLILLLGCATISVRSLERIVAKKISLVLKGEGEFCAAIAESRQEVHPHHPLHNPSCWRNVRININRADDHYHLHHVHDHSCFQTVEEVMLRTGKEDENQSHSCWRTVEDTLRRAEKREENDKSCLQTVEDAAERGKKAEEEQYRRHCHYCWRRVEDAVLKAWIIVRAYSVQPVLARSALTAAAAFLLTVQIVITIVGGVSKVLDVKNKSKENPYERIATVLQCILIFIGWSLIVIRWASAVAYYRSSEEDSSWRGGLRVEDYWTRHLRDLQQARNRPLQQAKSLDNKIDELVSRKGITGSVPSILLSATIWLQWLLVSFSKACWLASLTVFHNKWTSKLYSFVFRKHEQCVDENYSKYRHMLEDVQMIGETSESLWVAHRSAIEKAKRLILQGNQDGEYNCDHLIEFLIKKRTPQGLGLRCLDPHKPQTELKFICKKRSTDNTRQPQEPRDVTQQQSGGRGKEPLAVEERFSDASTKSWKMTAVSLLGIIVHLAPIYADIDKARAQTPQAVKDCLDAYSQAWEIIDFLEEADTEADDITSEAADMYFHELQTKVDNEDFSAEPATPEGVRAALQQLQQESESNTGPLENANFISKFMYAVLINGKEEKERGRPNVLKSNDSTDWKASAAHSSVCYLCSSIECNDGTEVSELLNELESSLADVLNECLAKAQQLLLVKSREWALNMDETRMGKALYTAGKAKALMEKLVCNKLAIVSCR